MNSTVALSTLRSWETRKPLQRLRHIFRLVTLASADACAFLAADLLFRWNEGVPALTLSSSYVPMQQAAHIDVFLLLAISFIIVRCLAGDYSRRLLFWDSARLTTKALAIASIPDVLLLIVSKEHYSSFAIIMTWVFLIVAVPMLRQLARVAMSAIGVWHIPSAFVGDSARAGDIHNALSASLSLGFELRTVISTERNAMLREALPQLDHVLAADAQDAVKRVRQAGCEQAVVAAEDMQSSQFADIIQSFLEADIAVAIAPTLRRLPLVGLGTSYFFGKDILLLQVRNNLRHLPRRVLKRSFDIVGATALLMLLSPLFAAIAIAIKRFDKGPILYEHERIGHNRRPFKCLKFRTMAVDAEERLARWQDEDPDLYEEFQKNFKLRDDPRVTRPGKWLRKTSLDELPQLINVLRGEMSLVGPRPVVESELDNYYGPAAQLYARVQPGMTGLWQVSGRSDTTYEERVTYDEWYVLNWSFWYDIVILLRTARIVLSGKGAF
jgi:undecaprenyl-phosphate galactose phosphotransferase